MYDWLDEAIPNTACVVTANRRLARTLREAHAERQIREGRTAWQSPPISSWHDWLDTLFDAASIPADLPTRIDAHQSQLIWDRCLRGELGDDATGMNNLVRLARDAWKRLADWQLGIRDVARSAQNSDQRIFAAAAGRYVATLERERWIDDAGLSVLVPELIEAGRIPVGGRFLFAGFDREKPALTRLASALAANGCETAFVDKPRHTDEVELRGFESPAEEFRVAGAWARRLLDEDPNRSIAIVASNLERDASPIARLVREGLVPGWKFGPRASEQVLNVSYGRRLGEYPVVSMALLAASWLVRDLTSIEVSHLLRSPLVGVAPVSGRCRLELRLRRLPERRWSPSMITAVLANRETGGDASDWLSRVAAVTRRRRALARGASPAEWAVTFDEYLRNWLWPGAGQLDSEDFQVVNRWRELLNDFARLDLVSPQMRPDAALHRLEILASDTVFQPELGDGRVHLLGPLEASGAEYDAVWIAGATATNWPPPGNPSPLLSRRLQSTHRMPDACPDDTVGWARNLLGSLVSAAPLVVCSYAESDGDAGQTPTALLRAADGATDLPLDRGWFASELVTARNLEMSPDRVPAILPTEYLSGGAGTIQRQLTDPIAAFVQGRLGVSVIQPQATGLPAPLRGNIIHDALQSLYVERPSRAEIAGWAEPELSRRVSRALDFGFSRHERQADAVLAFLFRIERDRVAALLRGLVALDVDREDFAVDAVEHEIDFTDGSVRLELRADRIDRLTDGSVVILDYKTGSPKKFLTSGEPREIQLVAYACGLEERVATLALVNVDSRAIEFDGAGRGFTDTETWAATLDRWKQIVHDACLSLSKGDVRVNVAQTPRDARSLNLLTRFTELTRDH